MGQNLDGLVGMDSPTVSGPVARIIVVNEHQEVRDHAPASTCVPPVIIKLASAGAENLNKPFQASPMAILAVSSVLLVVCIRHIIASYNLPSMQEPLREASSSDEIALPAS